MEKTRLYIGIEIKVREFDAKLLLACFAAEAGFDVFIGQQKWFVKHLETMPRGVWMNKSISPTKAKAYAHYKKLGVPLVAYDEEGLVPFSADEYQKRRISAESLQHLDCFFAWGDWQTNVILEKAPSAQAKIERVGHPRLDLTRRELRGFYADEVRALQERYGQFMLINTNFSFYNHFSGPDGKLAFLEKAGKIADEGQRAYYLRLRDHKKRLFHEFADLVVALRQGFPDYAVVLRPHPSENHDYWRQILPQDEKIFVVHEGNVHPWILASQVMIHNSCTTGVEGYLLEQPTIAYRPFPDDELESYLPNALSLQEFSREALLDRIASCLSHQPMCSIDADPEKHAIAARYIASVDGPLACERVVKRLQTIRPPALNAPMLAYRSYIGLKHLKADLLRTFAPPSAAPPSDGKAQGDYVSQKFPGISLSDINNAIAKFQSLTHRFSNLRVTQLRKNLFHIVCNTSN